MAKRSLSPVQVTKDGDSLNIDVYIKFIGGADRIFPVPSGAHGRQTCAQAARHAIESRWSGTFTLYGRQVAVTTRVHTVSADKKQKFIKFGFNHNKSPLMRSTTGGLRGLAAGYIKGNECINWSVAGALTPVNINMYEGNDFIARYWFETTAAHEFGHVLGLGDAYNAGYRGGSWPWTMDGYFAPFEYYEEESGTKTLVQVPDGDIMLERGFNGNDHVTDNNIRMAWEAHRRGKPVFYPWGSKDFSARRDNKIVHYRVVE